MTEPIDISTKRPKMVNMVSTNTVTANVEDTPEIIAIYEKAGWVRQEDFVRLSVNLNEKTATELKEMMAEKDLSATEIVRRAVLLYDYLAKAVVAGGVIEITDDHVRIVKKVELL